MTALTIDSSVFVSALLENDPHRSDAVFFLTAIRNKQEPIVIPSVVAAEVINVLIRHGVSEPEILLGSFGKYTTINLDNNFIINALNHWRKISLKTSDAIVALTSAIYDTVLVSWDEKLVAEAGNITKAVTPADFMRLGN